MQRIVIVGATGSGKTTLARSLSRRLDLPHIEADAIFWGPNWNALDHDTFRRRMELALSGPKWVMDGNYAAIRDLAWGRADTLVWLDYPFLLVFWRLLRRTIPRIYSREMLWGTNRETWRNAFLSRDSLFIWLLQSYPRHKRTYPQLLAQPEYAHLAVVRLKSPNQTNHWLTELAAPPTAAITGGQ